MENLGLAHNCSDSSNHLSKWILTEALIVGHNELTTQVVWHQCWLRYINESNLFWLHRKFWYVYFFIFDL